MICFVLAALFRCSSVCENGKVGLNQPAMSAEEASAESTAEGTSEEERATSSSESEVDLPWAMPAEAGQRVRFPDSIMDAVHDRSEAQVENVDWQTMSEDMKQEANVAMLRAGGRARRRRCVSPAECMPDLGADLFDEHPIILPEAPEGLCFG